MGRRGLLLVFLVGCGRDEAEEGRYRLVDPPDAQFEVSPIERADAAESKDGGAVIVGDADASPGVTGSCVRDESRDSECVGYDGPDAGDRYAIACPADDAGNPTLPPPAIGCNYTGWADAGTLTMCCK